MGRKTSALQGIKTSNWTAERAGSLVKFDETTLPVGLTPEEATQTLSLFQYCFQGFTYKTNLS